ncbi:MAG: PilZ domain-containing protein [Acidobacteriota bacterium]|nr:PilZ domain-containing protein [Acidobacteriota bacterium]
MAMLSGLFGKKKELKGDDIRTLFDTITVLREPVIVQTSSFKYVSDILGYDHQAFFVKNTLSRDEVLYQIRGNQLKVHFPYELTMYGGQSRLTGLGMVGTNHTLKLQIPQALVQTESRGAYRVSRFPETPSVTFTTDNFDIIKARLADVSMTGAGLRLDPRWARGNEKLAARLHLILDIKLTDDLRISTTGMVRYVRGAKMGVQFEDLGKRTKDKLFKFIVQQRREEQRAMIQLRSRFEESQTIGDSDPAAQQPAKASPTGKPTTLLVCDDQQQIDFLSSALGRKFDLIFAEPSISDIRAQLALNPNLCLMQLKSQDQNQVRTMRKAGTLLPPGCVLMFFGQNMDEGFVQRFESLDYPEGILVDLTNGKKLLVFKQIQSYYDQRAPR